MTAKYTSATAPNQDIRLIGAGEWDSFIARLGTTDTYSCAAYHRASALLEPAGTRPALLAYADEAGEVALPLLLRPLPVGAGWDATSAYGYGGPIGRGLPNLDAFGAALNRWAEDQHVVTTFLRLNPLLDNGRLVPPKADLVDVSSTVVWDVQAGRSLIESLHPDQRRSVRKAERAGVSVTVTPRPQNLEHMKELYAATMQRKGATEFFFFPNAYWQALVTDDPLMAPLLVEAHLEDRVISTLLCFVSAPWLHAHLSAGSDKARAVGASSACYLAAAQWAQAQGLTGFHLGGGVGGSTATPLYAFKQRFDPGRPPRLFQVAKLVHDGDRFRELAGTDSISGFFPPWRCP